MCEINKAFEDFGQSEFYGRKAYEMNPNDPRIVSAYGELLVLTGRAGEGTELLIKAYELDPEWVHPMPTNDKRISCSAPMSKETSSNVSITIPRWGKKPYRLGRKDRLSLQHE